MIRFRRLAAALLLGLALAAVAVTPVRAQEKETDGFALTFELPDMNKKALAKLHDKKFDEAIAAFREIVDSVEKSDLRPRAKHAYQASALYNIACAFALDGKKPEATKELAHAVELGFRDWHLIETDTDLESIRDGEDFKRAVEAGKAAEKAEIDAEVQKAVADVNASLAGTPVIADYDLDVTTIEGKPLKLSAPRGKVVVVTWFWPSITDTQAVLFPEVRRLVKLRAETDRKDVEIVGLCMAVNDDSDGSELAKFMKRRGVNSPVAKVTADKLVKGAHVLFIDRTGKVRANLREPRQEVVDAVTKALVEAGAEGAPAAKPETPAAEGK